MATTSPDNIRTPDLGDPYNLVPDLQTLANDVQDALIERANSYTGTEAQRVAFASSAPEGALWVDTDGGKHVWRNDGGVWERLVPEDTGWVDISNSLSTPYRGTLFARRIGMNAEIRLSSASGATYTEGNTSLGTVPSAWRPASSLPNVRGGAYFASGYPGILYLTPSGDFGVTQRTGGTRNHAQGSMTYFIN